MKSQATAKTEFDFPVALENLRTDDNKIITGFKGVRRTDTGRVLSIVTNRYQLVEHQRVLDGAEKFIEALGAEPERQYHVSKHGALFTAELVYKTQIAEAAVGERVGLRVFLMSSYTGAHLNRIKIGGLVLSCKNGMVTPSKQFNHVFRHIGSNNMAFPNVDEVLTKFHFEAAEWKRYAEQEIKQLKPYLDNLRECEILPEQGIHYISGADRPIGYVEPKTAWEFLQKCTFFVTHLNSRIGPLGKMDRLEKLAVWFKKNFGG